jgi:diguanylate cyclase (GGDEF)-like protein
MHKSSKDFLIIYFVVFLLLLLVSLFEYQLFHVSVEMITIFFGIFVFVLATNSKKYTKNLLLLIIGILYLYVGILDFLHAVSYNGLNIIFDDTNMSNQFWISARLLESSGFFIAITFYKNKNKLNISYLHLLLTTYTAVAIILISTGSLPVFYSLEQGQTLVKILIEYVVILLYLLTIISLTRNCNKSNMFCYSLYIVLSVKILSELAFTQYTNTVDTYVIIGHLLKYLSFAGIYIIFVSEILIDPKKQIYSLFKQKENELIHISERDHLTGLYNHQTTFEKITEMIELNNENIEQLFIAMIDIDDFKFINDTYGHQFGDTVLQRFSKTLSNLNCGQKVIGRYGGDEFLVCGTAENTESRNICFRTTKEEIRKEFSDMDIPITFSVGLVFCKVDDTLKDLIYKADINLYTSKKNGKNQITF